MGKGNKYPRIQQDNYQDGRPDNCLVGEVVFSFGGAKWTVRARGQGISYSVPCVLESGGRELLALVNWRRGAIIIDSGGGSVGAEKRGLMGGALGGALHLW